MNTQLLGYSESCFAELVATAMPVHLKVLHLVHFPADDAGKKKLLHTIFPNTLKRLGASAFEWTHIHTGSTQEEILDKMQNAWFSRDKLPMRLGGTWASVPFASLSDTLVASPEANWNTPCVLVTAQSTAEGVLSEAVAEKPQTMSSIYSKRKRGRRKQRLEAVEEDCSRLLEKNKLLKTDNQKLELLLARAEGILAETESAKSQGIRTSAAFAHESLLVAPSNLMGGFRQRLLGAPASVARLGVSLSAPTSLENLILNQAVLERFSQQALLPAIPMTTTAALQAQVRAHQYHQTQQRIAVLSAAMVLPSPIGTSIPVGHSTIGGGTSVLPSSHAGTLSRHRNQQIGQQRQQQQQYRDSRKHFEWPPGSTRLP
jgi:hypothetical protein